MGFATTDLNNFKILEDIPSFPVAFFMPILLMFCEPMSLATFMKKLLNVSATSVWLFIILSFSHNFYHTSLP